MKGYYILLFIIGLINWVVAILTDGNTSYGLIFMATAFILIEVKEMLNGNSVKTS